MHREEAPTLRWLSTPVAATLLPCDPEARRGQQGRRRLPRDVEVR